MPQKKGAPRTFDADEHPRPETTAAELAALPPAFRKQNGTVTAGNASGHQRRRGGGAARVARAALARLAAGAGRWRASSRRRVAGVEPKLMGLGPIPATRRRSRAPASPPPIWI